MKLRPAHRHIGQIGQALNEIVAIGHTAINTQFRAFAKTIRRISAHGVDQVVGLKGPRVKGRSRDLWQSGISGQAQDRASGIGIPPGRAKAGKGRHHDNTVIGLGKPSERFGRLRTTAYGEAFTEPLYRRPGDEDGPF